MKIIHSYLLLFLLETSVSWRLFFRGRGKNGNLGSPLTYIKDLPEEKWFDQKLDHFDPTNLARWQQRYFVNDTFYDPQNGAVFLMIGGEAAADPKWMVNGTWLNYAEKYNALCIMLEHRYYGKSHPVMDLSVKNLAYLTSEQALADIATFIVHNNEQLGNNPKWIVFGGSYPGSLAAWMRLKYPHLVLGAVSSSGPLIAKADFKEYYEVVEEALRSYSDRCVYAIQKGTQQLTKLLSSKNGRSKIFNLFKLCDPIHVKNQYDISNLYENLASNFAGVVQYNKDNRHVENSTDPNITIDFVCDIMINASSGNELVGLAKVNEALLQASNETCLDYKYDKMIGEIRSFDWSSKSADGMRQWTYQTCTEFGFYQTSTLNSTKILFGEKFPVEFFEQQCKDIFGNKFNISLLAGGILHTNTLYGGLDIRADNIVFVHGSVDPWHVLGITNTLRTSEPAIYINGTAHCANMYPSSPDDLPQLVSARYEIQNLIGSWLDQNSMKLS